MAAGAVGQRRRAVATTPAREFSAREWERVLHPRVRGSRSPPSSQFLLHVLPCPSLCTQLKSLWNAQVSEAIRYLPHLSVLCRVPHTLSSGFSWEPLAVQC